MEDVNLLNSIENRIRRDDNQSLDQINFSLNNFDNIEPIALSKQNPDEITKRKPSEGPIGTHLSLERAVRQRGRREGGD